MLMHDLKIRSGDITMRNKVIRTRIGFIFSSFLIVFAQNDIANAGALAEFLFWESVGNTVAAGAKAHDDYRKERQLWKDKIAAAEAELERCGGCASAQAELDKWQGIENDFQDVAGRLAQSAGMPPQVATWLGIDMSLTSGPTQAHRDEKRVVMPSWAGERPEYCQKLVEKHIKCMQNYQSVYGLYADLGGARGPGGQCYDTRKLYVHCAREDYDAFKREEELQQARAEGEIIPEYVNFSGNSVVYFDEVPENFIPTFPPTDVVISELKEPDIWAVRYMLDKKSAGQLLGFEVRWNNDTYYAPGNNCTSVGATHTEVQRRECEDISEMRMPQYGGYMLSCFYGFAGGSNNKYVDQSLFWYGSRPERADPERLLKRSYTNPILVFADPRTTCPGTKTEADTLQAQYQAKLDKIKGSVPQIPESTVLPIYDWIKERQDAAAARYEQIKRAGKLLLSQPIVGVYEFENRGAGQVIFGRCIFVEKYQYRFKVNCIDPEGNHTIVTKAQVTGDYLEVFWKESVVPLTEEKRLNISYLFDEEKWNSGLGHVLNRVRGESADSAWLKRVDDVPEIEDFPIVGAYDLELSVNGITETIQCDMSISKSHSPPRYPVECTLSDGIVYKGEGKLEKANGNTLKFTSWYPNYLMVGGVSVNRLYFIIGDIHQIGGQERTELVGFADREVRARFIPKANIVNVNLENSNTDTNQPIQAQETKQASVSKPKLKVQEPPTTPKSGEKLTKAQIADLSVGGISLGMDFSEAEEIILKRIDAGTIVESKSEMIRGPFPYFKAYHSKDESESIVLYKKSPDEKEVVAVVQLTSIPPDSSPDKVISELSESFGSSLEMMGVNKGYVSGGGDPRTCAIKVGQTRSAALLDFQKKPDGRVPYTPLLNTLGSITPNDQRASNWTECDAVFQFKIKRKSSVQRVLYDLGQLVEL